MWVCVSIKKMVQGQTVQTAGSSRFQHLTSRNAPTRPTRLARPRFRTAPTFGKQTSLKKSDQKKKPAFDGIVFNALFF